MQELADWSKGTWTTVPTTGVRAVSNDTRALSAGDVYVALKGERFDGHGFLDDAFAAGACGAVVAKGHATVHGDARPLLLVQDTGQALIDMAAGYREKVGARTIGVTGSAGKSTVKELIAALLAQAIPTAATRGNWNNSIGLPLSLLAMPLETEAGVFELGMNHPGEIQELADILKPTWGVVTNVGLVHIEFFESIEAIASEKAALLRALPSDGAAVLETGAPYFDMLAGATSARIVTVSCTQEADYTGVQLNNDWSVCERSSGDTFLPETDTDAEHMRTNLLMAVAVARQWGLTWDQIQAGLMTYRPLPMRWERISVGGLDIINDAYNANPVSMRASIDAFCQVGTPSRRWLVLGDMMELGEQAEREHVALGELIGTRMWAGIVVVGERATGIAKGALRAGVSDDAVFFCATTDEATRVLSTLPARGDAVLLKASRAMRFEEIIAALRKQDEEM